ncbi:MAG: hypothetical protein ABWW70_02965 [Thermoproteota archaeon]
MQSPEPSRLDRGELHFAFKEAAVLVPVALPAAVPAHAALGGGGGKGFSSNYTLVAEPLVEG